MLKYKKQLFLNENVEQQQQKVNDLEKQLDDMVNDVKSDDVLLSQNKAKTKKTLSTNKMNSEYDEFLLTNLNAQKEKTKLDKSIKIGQLAKNQLKEKDLLDKLKDTEKTTEEKPKEEKPKEGEK